MPFIFSIFLSLDSSFLWPVVMFLLENSSYCNLLMQLVIFSFFFFFYLLIPAFFTNLFHFKPKTNKPLAIRINPTRCWREGEKNSPFSFVWGYTIHVTPLKMLILWVLSYSWKWVKKEIMIISYTNNRAVKTGLRYSQLSVRIF